MWISQSYTTYFDFFFFLLQELELEEGDIITIVGKEDDLWWCGNLKGKIGMFPSSYVEHYNG